MNKEEIQTEIQSMISQRDSAFATYHQALGAIQFAEFILKKMDETVHSDPILP